MGHLAQAAVLVFVCLGLELPCGACPAKGRWVYVDVHTHRLSLCDASREVKSYRVALGRGGIDKTRSGDGRTPVGTYPLGTPRRSERFLLFLPVGYPTLAQRSSGSTGSAVGVHGPARAFRWAGAANIVIDWTQGCIALGSDDEINEVASWVRTEQVRQIRIE
jgi:murein L,D-transpeptidase YafK